MALTKSDFEKYDVNEVLGRREDDGDLTAWSYRTVCIDEREQHVEAQDETGNELFTLLGNVSSFLLHPHNMDPYAPFDYMKDVNGNRRELTDLFCTSDLDFLTTVVRDITEPIMRAQIADVLWVCRHGDGSKHKIALLASKAYLESINQDALTLGMENRLERALQIATLLNNSEWLDKGLCRAKELAATRQLPGDWERMMVLLAKYSRHDHIEYIEQICQKADEVEGEGLFTAAVRFREDALNLFIENKLHDRVKEVRLELTVTLVASAEQEVCSGSGEDWRTYRRAQSHIEKAIEHHKNASGANERLAKLHALLAKYSKKLEENLDWQDMCVNTEISQDDQDALNAIGKGIAESLAGKPFEEALLILAGCLRPPETEMIRKGSQQIIQDEGLASLFESRVLNHAGKTVGRSEPFSVGWYAASYRTFLAFFAIRPAIEQINQDHDVQFENVVKALEQSDFVPAHSRKTFARGLLAGFEDDLAVVAHILPPMLENAFREMLASMGINTSWWNDEHVSEEQSLGQILKHPAIGKVLGTDLLFDLKTLLLTEDGGMNLRNSVLHGLTTDSYFFPERQGKLSQKQAQVLYLWWLALRLCFVIKKKDPVE